MTEAVAMAEQYEERAAFTMHMTEMQKRMKQVQELEKNRQHQKAESVRMEMERIREHLMRAMNRRNVDGTFIENRIFGLNQEEDTCDFCKKTFPILQNAKLDMNIFGQPVFFSACPHCKNTNLNVHLIKNQKIIVLDDGQRDLTLRFMELHIREQNSPIIYENSQYYFHKALVNVAFENTRIIDYIFTKIIEHQNIAKGQHTLGDLKIGDVRSDKFRPLISGGL